MTEGEQNEGTEQKEEAYREEKGLIMEIATGRNSQPQ